MLVSVGTMIYLAVLSLMEARRRAISAWLLLLVSILAAALAGWLLWQGTVHWEELLFGAVPGVILLAIAGMTGSAGCGDGIVLLQVSLLLLMERAVIAFGVSMVVMGAFATVILLKNKKNKDLRLPYLPFLWLGCLVSLCS